MSLFLLGFLLKGSQKLDCQLLTWLFAADNKGINYFHIKTELLLFLIVLGLRLPHFTYSVQFNFVQQCIQISTRINSSMYICTYVFVSFETYPIFNMVSE